MKKIILILALLGVSMQSFADDCGGVTECISGIQYPYSFCNEKGESEVCCADDPQLFADTSKGKYIKRMTYMPIAYGMGSYTANCVAHLQRYNGVLVFDYNQTVGEYWGLSTDAGVACDKWNCLCGFDTVDANAMGRITIMFADDAKYFKERGLNPMSTIANTEISNTLYPGYACEINVSDSRIFLNVTPDLTFGKDSFPQDINTPFKVGWMNQKYKKNVGAIPPDVKLYSFQYTIMHEIGHLLGFGHYDDLSGGQVCDNGDIYLSGVMSARYNDIRTDADEFSTYDICMFKKLYCPELVGIDDWIPWQHNVTITPNPANNIITISATLDEPGKLALKIVDQLGKDVLNIYNNKYLDTETIQLNVDISNFAAGTYFLQINTQGRMSFKQFIKY